VLTNIKNNDFFSEVLYSAMVELCEFLSDFKPNHSLLGSYSEHRETFNLYESYPLTQRQKILSDFEDYSLLLKNAISNSNDVANSHSLLWGALKTLKLSFDESMFPNLKKDDVVEIYRNDNIQVFRNLKFHEICSYRYPELFIHQWHSLFQRDQNVTNEILKAAKFVFSGKASGSYDVSGIGRHEMREINSPERLETNMLLKTLYPLKNNDGDTPYIVAVSNVQLNEVRSFRDYENVYSL